MRKETKVIKLDLEVYNRLEELREKRESFSQVVGRLIELHLLIDNYIKEGGGELVRKAGLK